MAKASERSRTGNVTVATVRHLGEARQLAAKLEAAGIECAVVEERVTVPPSGGRYIPGGIKVQVDRADIQRALDLLRHKPGAAKSPAASSLDLPSWLKLPAEGWWRTGIEAAALLATAVALALLFFL